MQTFKCFECGGPMTVIDAQAGLLMTINVEGMATTVHTLCPVTEDTPEKVDTATIL